MDLKIPKPAVPKLRNMSTIQHDNNKTSPFGKRSFNNSQMQRTHDFRTTDMDDERIGMIGEFLKHEDCKELAKQEDEDKKLKKLNEKHYFKLEDLKKHSVLSNDKVSSHMQKAEMTCRVSDEWQNFVTT